MSSRSASALLDAALAVPFDPEEEDRRQLALARQEQWDSGPVAPTELNVAAEEPTPFPQIEQAMPGLYTPQEQALIDQRDANGEPPLPQADEDLPPVGGRPAGPAGPTGGGGSPRRSASALLAEIPAAEVENVRGPVIELPRAEGTLDAIGNAITRGLTMNRMGRAFEEEKPDASRVLDLQEVMREAPASAEFQAAMNDDLTPQESWQAFKAAPVKVMGELLAESFSAFLPQMFEKAPARMAVGAGLGAGVAAAAGQAGPQVFLPEEVVTVPAGMAIGARAGYAEAAGASSLTLEMAGGILEAMEEAGVRMDDPQALRAALEDPERMALAREFAMKKAVPVAAFDAGSALIAGRLVGKRDLTRVQKILRGAGETFIQSFMGAAGEAAGQLAQKGEITSVRSVMAEGLAETATGAVDIAAGMAFNRGETGTAAGQGPRRSAAAVLAAELGEQGAPRVVVEQDDVFGEATTAEAQQPAAEPAGPTGEDLFGEVEQRGETIVTPPPAEAAVVSDLGALPTVELPVNELQLSRDVPNFKEGADEATGVVAGERLEGTYQRLGTAPIIVWERTDGRREIISGRHRWDLAKRTGEQTIPSQVVREADGFTQRDALTLDAELNIRDGQGSIKDYANYFRNAQIDRETATQGGLLSRAKGRAGFEIGRSAGNDLYAAFANGAVSADKAAAIAGAAPNNDAVQRAALARAGNMTAEQLPGFVRVVAGMTTGPAETQTDLFGADDTALVQAERLSKAANAKARQIQEQITAVRSAARRPEAAARMGVNVKDPQGVLRRITQLEGEAERYRNFHQYPEVMAELQTLRVEEGPGDLTLAGPDAQAYFNFADVPRNKQQAGQEAVDAAAETSSVPYQAAPVSARQGVDRSGELRGARERQAIAYRALLAGDAATVAAAIRDGVPLSRLMLGFIGREQASFNIRGAIIKSPQDLALYNLAHRTPFFESLKVAVLDDRRQVIASQVVSTGTLNESLAHPRDILAVIEAARAANPNAKIGGFMIMHNHPSGDPTPSDADRQVTRRMQLAGETIGVPLLDHVITNGERYVSFQESGMMINPQTGNFARANAKPKLSVLPPAEGAFREGARATWEAAPASTAGTFRISNENKLQTVRTLLQTADPGMVHILNLDTRYGILSVDRHPLGTKAEDMIKGSLAQGTYAVAISLPMMPPQESRTLVRALRTGFNDVFAIYVNDAMGVDNQSFRQQGLLEEPAAPYDGGETMSPEQLRPIVRAVHAEAAAQRDGFLRDVRDAARTAGGRAVERIFPKALKKLPAALAKTERSPKVPTDLLRTTIEAPAGGAAAARRVAAKFIEAMRARGYEIYAPGGRPDITDRHDSQDAYKDIALKFVKDGAGVDPVVKEVLVIQPAMLSVKSRLHDYYDRWREAVRRGMTETENDRVLMLRKAARKAEAQAAKVGQEAYARDSRTPRYQALSAVQSSEDMSSTSLGMSGISGNPASATARAMSFVGVSSIRDQDTAPPGGTQGGFRVAEEPARTKPRQLEEKAKRNEALAPETRARLGSEYLPISLNAQAEAAKEWINTNGLEAAKVRIAQLASEEATPAPLDFAIGIEAAGRLSATGDHAGAAGIVATMSQRATGMGQTISVLAMMARLSPEGIVLYGENIIGRYINTLSPEAQERIRALQAEVAALRKTLADLKFDQGSEVIRTGKLGGEKLQDKIKRRQRAKVSADLGPDASGPEVTAETRQRVIRMNVAVRDVLLSDATRAEATKAIEAILVEQGNFSPAEAGAMTKSIVEAFTRIVREARVKYVQGARAGAGSKRGGFDRLLALLREGKEMSDADFLGEISRLMGLPGMTPALARELRALGQRYERATDPDVRMVLAAQMYEKAHELVPTDFWVKVRGFAYLSMLFAPKTWIRNVVGNQIQWIANVGRDAVVTGLLDPALSLFTGQRTSAGLKLGARLRGLLAPIEDVRRGYMWNKRENPQANFRENLAAGVNHLRVLSKLTTQNKFEIADVRNVGGRIFSSKFMRLWEGGLSIALGAGDRAFWMSQFRASLAQMQAAAERNGTWSGQPTPEMIEAAFAESAYAIYQNPNLLSQQANRVRTALNRLTTFGRTDQYGLGTVLMAFTQVPGSLTLRGLIEWSPLGFIPTLYRGMRGLLYATTEGGRGAKFDQAAFNKEFTQALIGTGAFYAAGYYLYAMGIITASREDDDDLEAMRRASGLGAYRINLTALRRALLSGNWFTRQEAEDGDLIASYDWAQPVAFTVAAGAEFAAQVERANRQQLKKNLADRAGMAAISLVAGAKSLEELPLLSGLMSFMGAIGQRPPPGESRVMNAMVKTVTSAPSMFIPQLVRQATQLSDNSIRTMRAGDAAQREFDRIVGSLPGMSTRFPQRFDVTGQAIERYQYDGNTVANVLLNPALTSRYKADPVLQEVGRLLNATGETGMVPREVLRKTNINGQSVELTNEQIAAYQYYVGNFTMSHFRWRMAAPVYARLPDEVKAKMLADDLRDIHAAVKSAALGADPRRLTRRQLFLRQALVNSPLGQSVPPR